MAVALPRWCRPRAEPKEQHRESKKQKQNQISPKYKIFYLFTGALVLAAAALNLLGPGGGHRRPSSCPLLLLLAKASLFLLPWKSSESSAAATRAATSHNKGASVSNGTRPTVLPSAACRCLKSQCIYLAFSLALSRGKSSLLQGAGGDADTAAVPSLLSDVSSVTCNCFKAGSALHCCSAFPVFSFPTSIPSAVLQQKNSASAFFVIFVFDIFLMGKWFLAKSIKTWSLPWPFVSTTGIFLPSSVAVVSTFGLIHCCQQSVCVLQLLSMKAWVPGKMFHSNGVEIKKKIVFREQTSHKPSIIVSFMFLFSHWLFLVWTHKLPGSGQEAWSTSEDTSAVQVLLQLPTQTATDSIPFISVGQLPSLLLPTNWDVFPHSPHLVYFCEMEATVELCLLATAYYFLLILGHSQYLSHCSLYFQE